MEHQTKRHRDKAVRNIGPDGESIRRRDAWGELIRDSDRLIAAEKGTGGTGLSPSVLLYNDVYRAGKV